MTDLSASLPIIHSKITSALTNDKTKAMLFVLVDGANGGIEIYLSPTEHPFPYEALVGQPIDEVIIIPAWEEEWAMICEEAAEGGLRFPDGSVSRPTNQSDFNMTIAQYVNECVKSLIPKLDQSIIPKIIAVEDADSGYFSEKWRPTEL